MCIFCWNFCFFSSKKGRTAYWSLISKNFITLAWLVRIWRICLERFRMYMHWILSWNCSSVDRQMPPNIFFLSHFSSKISNIKYVSLNISRKTTKKSIKFPLKITNFSRVISGELLCCLHKFLKKIMIKVATRNPPPLKWFLRSLFSGTHSYHVVFIKLCSL